MRMKPKMNQRNADKNGVLATRSEESWVFMISAGSSILGACFLFEPCALATSLGQLLCGNICEESGVSPPVPTPGWILLVADCIIYTGATVAGPRNASPNRSPNFYRVKSISSMIHSFTRIER